MNSTLPLAALALLSLAGCSQNPAEDSETPPVDVAAGPSASATVEAPNPSFTNDDLIGRWIGVEGMYLDIQSAGAGTYTLEMQSDLDTLGTYPGTSTAEGISFVRGGETLTLLQSDGAATGLKWLDGKQDCLMVAAGEGYCRD